MSRIRRFCSVARILAATTALALLGALATRSPNASSASNASYAYDGVAAPMDRRGCLDRLSGVKGPG